MTTPVEQIQRAIDLIRAAQHTLACRPEDETAVREAVTRSPCRGLFDVQVSGFLPAGTGTAVSDRATRPATTRNDLRHFPAHPKPAGYPDEDKVYDALDTLDVTWDEAMASLRRTQIPTPTDTP